MKTKTVLSICLAVLLIPPTSHVYMHLETKARLGLNRIRAGVTMYLLQRLTKAPDLQNLVRMEAIKHGIPPELANAVVAQESAWNPSAIRPEPRINTASYGLFQILPGTAKNCPGAPTAEELLHPVTNTKCGLYLLGSYLKSTKSPRQALVAYNGGTKCLTGRCPAAESYASTVLSRYSESLF